MSGGIIYEKQTNSSSHPIDRCLIIDPYYAYIRRFNFDDDWNHIRLGMFLSYTASATNPNLSYGSTSNITSGVNDNSVYSFMGIIRDGEDKYLPNALNSSPLNEDQSFLGFFYNQYFASSTQNLRRMRYNNSSRSYNSDCVYLSSNENSSVFQTNNQANDDNRHNIQLERASDTSDFATYFAIDFQKNGSNIIMRNYQNYQSPLDLITNVSLENLLIYLNTIDTARTNSFTATNLTGIDLPNAFFFYNGFLNIRPRIHALAVRKID
jgi:hypothetical protein